MSKTKQKSKQSKIKQKEETDDVNIPNSSEEKKIKKQSKPAIDRTLIEYSQDQIKDIKHVGNKKPIIFIGMGSCGIAAGAQETYNAILDTLGKKKIDAEIVKVGCIGSCFCEPILDIKLPGRTRISYKAVSHNKVENILTETIINKIPVKEQIIGQYPSDDDKSFPDINAISDDPFFKYQKKFVLSRCGIVNPESLKEYIAYDKGYHALVKILEKNDPKWVINEIKKSGLRGRGGAGFPTGLKWEFAHNTKSPDGQKYVIMNADEGDPGAFMNRAELESDPYSAVEGMTIIGFAIGASEGFIYCRAEYPLVIERLNHAIKEAEKNNLLGKNIMGSDFSFELHIKAGAGAFVCGEETALIQSIEGNRGQPDIKPPYPTTSGLFRKPTVINNVETIHQIAKIINMGGSEFNKIGTDKSKGTKVFSLTGKINKSGLVEVPMGTPISKVIEMGGGILDGAEYKAVQCGGPSGGCVPKQHMDIPLDYESLLKVGAMMGSGGLVVMDNNTCMVETARYFMGFIQSESCGKCIPCREGTRRMLETLEKLTSLPKGDEEVVRRMQSVMNLERNASVIKDTALCGLGNSAPNPVLSTLQYYRDEYEAHLYEHKCPAKQCLGLVTFKIDTKKCIGCGICRINCPVDAIVGEKKEAHYVIDDKCVHCGLCYENCNFDAVLKI